MIRGLAPFLAAGLLAAPPAPDPRTPLHVPDLATWRMELSPDLGGWSTNPSVVVRIKVVDPKDPEPPDETRMQGDFEDEEEGGNEARYLARRKAEEERQRRNAWRKRKLRIWFNGTARVSETSVGSTTYEYLPCQDGENRLEILEPDSGLRLVRTWWTFAARTRLVVRRVDADPVWDGGGLEVLEPDGSLAAAWRKTPSGGMAMGDHYTHREPPAGTYTLRWASSYRGAQPSTVSLEAVLDPGTERERRWTFSRLLIPGAGTFTLGTFDVEP